jgi:hypothetical protein
MIAPLEVSIDTKISRLDDILNLLEEAHNKSCDYLNGTHAYVVVAKLQESIWWIQTEKKFWEKK